MRPQHNILQIANESELQNLLIQVKNGDEEAFTLIYHHFFKIIYIKILSLVKDEETTDELVQDLFLKIWQKREDINVDLLFNAYLFKIAHNLVFDFFRKAAKDSKTMAHLMDGAIDYYLHSDAQYEFKESEQILMEAVGQLSPQRREIFTFCKLDGKSYKEAAAEFGISVATVNSHVTSSLKFVREYILNKHNTEVIVFVCSALTELLISKQN